MIISGYEKPVEYGVQLIFDPTMAAMVLRALELYNAAVKDEYERGLKDLDNFYTKYGDFISPFSNDMLRYGEMVGKIRGAVDEAAANGVNLLTSPEGRLFIQRLTHSIDPAEFNRMRTNAKLGFEYLDSIEKAKAKNEFNLNFEDWSLLQEGGPGLFKDFSSANGAMWNRPAPYVYQDLNLFTGHIFDKMEDSFIETLPDHYDYYGVSREARQQALTQHLSGLLSTQLGQYHYLNSKAAYERAIGRKLSDQEAMALWQRDILDSTQEYEHRNRKLNELWKMQQENAARRAGSKEQSSVSYDSAEGLFYRGLIYSGGTLHYDDIEKAVEDARDNIVDRQIQLLRHVQNQKMSDKDNKASEFILDNLSIEEDHNNFFDYTKIPKNDDGSFTIDDKVSKQLFDTGSVVDHMYGFSHTKGGKSYKRTTNRSELVTKVGYPRRKVSTVFNQKANGQYALRLFWEVEVGTVKDDGTFNKEKVMRCELPTSRSETTNVPDYTKYSKMNKDEKVSIIRPSLKENPRTLGWKNSGSMAVNKKEGVPPGIGFKGTANNEAFETE